MERPSQARPQGQGSMTRHRTIILIAGCLVAFGTAPSDAAWASSLLSGYGGPGQGNQAILGSALLKGPGGGSGSSGGGSGESGSLASSAGSSAASSEATAASGGSSTKAATGHKAAGSHANGAHHGSQAHRSASASAGPPSLAAVYAAAERNHSAPSTPALGLSGTDLLLIVLVLGMLALIGVLSRRLRGVPPVTTTRSAGGG